MNERRVEQRFMCSDLVTVQLENQGDMMVANLEDISPSGACLEMQQAVPADVMMILNCAGCRFRGKVRYCVFNESGYQVGVNLLDCKWSRQAYEPKHLLDAPPVRAGDLALLTQDSGQSRRLLADLTAVSRPRRMPCCGEESCPRADISRLIEPDSLLSDRVRVVARAVAWTCEELSAGEVRQCFSRWFQLPPECSLCDEFLLAYQTEYAVLSSKPAAEKRMAAGVHSDDF
jgi:hypothetical protein